VQRRGNSPDAMKLRASGKAARVSMGAGWDGMKRRAVRLQEEQEPCRLRDRNTSKNLTLLSAIRGEKLRLVLVAPAVRDVEAGETDHVSGIGGGRRRTERRHRSRI
jgi:hypothetical protein